VSIALTKLHFTVSSAKMCPFTLNLVHLTDQYACNVLCFALSFAGSGYMKDSMMKNHTFLYVNLNSNCIKYILSTYFVGYVFEISFSSYNSDNVVFFCSIRLFILQHGWKGECIETAIEVCGNHQTNRFLTIFVLATKYFTPQKIPAKYRKASAVKFSAVAPHESKIKVKVPYQL
jgi:hypothetical protein